MQLPQGTLFWVSTLLGLDCFLTLSSAISFNGGSIYVESLLVLHTSGLPGLESIGLIRTLVVGRSSACPPSGVQSLLLFPLCDKLLFYTLSLSFLSPTALSLYTPYFTQAISYSELPDQPSPRVRCEPSSVEAQQREGWIWPSRVLPSGSSLTTPLLSPSHSPKMRRSKPLGLSSPPSP